MIYYSIIGDIKKSKTYSMEERMRIQNNLNLILEEVNIKYKNVLASKMVITLGDEFQGLFKTPKQLFEIITYIYTSLGDVSLRFGIGVGELYTKTNTSSIGMDGPVWWNARKNIDIIKEHYEYGQTKTFMYISGLEERLETLINSELILISSIISKWSLEDKKFVNKIIKEYSLTTDIVQRDLALMYNLEPSNLNRKLKTMQYFNLVNALCAIENIL